MEFLTEIVTHTPPWVFLLLAYLVWQGTLALRPRIVPVWRMLVVPALFVAMGVSRLALGTADGVLPPLAWLGAACVFAGLGLAAGPRLLAVDRAAGTVTRAGSAVPLVRNVSVFLLQYGVAVATASYPQGHLAVTIVGRAVSGATAGFFIGWAWSFWRQYRVRA